MKKEVGEIVFEMEQNMNNPMKTLQSSVDQIFIKLLPRRILGKQGDEVMKRIFEAN
jgi:hypothetical protein